MPVNNIRSDGSRSRPIRAARTFLYKAPIEHRSGVHPKQSVYYWWYEFLKRNEEYRRCCKSKGKGRLAKLYKDFGNVFTKSFLEWWYEDHRGVRLFAEPLEPVTMGELNRPAEWDPRWTREGVMVVVVPLSAPKRRIKRWFNRLLAYRHTGKPGHPTKSESGAIYKVYKRFSVPSLEQMLLVYDLRQSEPDLTLAELGKRLELVETAMPKFGDSIDLLARKRRIMAATVSRYLRNATAMIGNTGKGKFPCAD